MSDLDHAHQMLAIARRDLKAPGGMLDAGEEKGTGYFLKVDPEK